MIPPEYEQRDRVITVRPAGTAPEDPAEAKGKAGKRTMKPQGIQHIH